jgi:hypothetical protein
MSEGNPNTMTIVVAIVLGAGMLFAALSIAGVFEPEPGLHIDKQGVEINLPKKK